jgi:hypothetical protein
MMCANLDPRFAIGMIADWRGQPYELIRAKPYRRRDGRDVLILVWRARCIECGEWFETATPQRTLRYPTRRCSQHVGHRV